MPFPMLDVDGKGRPSDPVNVLVVGEVEAFTGDLGKAGWQIAAPLTFETAAIWVQAFILGSADPTAPVSIQYLFGRQEDVALEKSKNVYTRDHFRAWKTAMTVPDGRPVWCLACTRDARIGWIPGHWLPDHVLDPDADAERDRVVSDLTISGHVTASYSLPGLGAGFKMVNGGGNTWQTNDGLIKVVELN